MQTKVRDRQADAALLEALNNVAPENLFGAPQSSVFSAPQSNPFGAPQGGSLGAALVSLSPSQEIHLGRPQRPEVRRNIMNYVVILGNRPSKKPAKYLWVPMFEYQCAWEGYMENEFLAMPDDLIDFTEAQYGRTWLDGYGPDNFSPEEFANAAYTGVAVTSTIETHVDCNPYFSSMESILRSELADRVKEYRQELVDFPQLVVEALEPYWYQQVATWAGIGGWSAYCGGTQSRDQILIDMARSTTTGVGAAAVDYVLWNCDTVPSRLRVEMEEIINEIQNDEFVSTTPADNIIIDSSNTHPQIGEASPMGSVMLYGMYAATRIEYMTDPTFGVVGYRDVFYEPHGDPEVPTLEGAQNFYQ